MDEIKALQQSSVDSYMDHGQATLQLKKMRTFSLIMFSLPLISMIIFFIGSHLYTPPKRDVLLNHLGSLYREEDLTKTVDSEGEVKQLALDWMGVIFNSNYQSFLSDEHYAELLSNKRPTSLPDHRDLIRNYFSEQSYQEVIKNLQSAPWMTDFRTQKRRTLAQFYSPPIHAGEDVGFSVNDAGRLEVKYAGYFYVNSRGFKSADRLFRVDYNIVMERKPNNVYPELPKYFFQAMVPANTTSWRISKLTWDAKRER